MDNDTTGCIGCVVILWILGIIPSSLAIILILLAVL